MKGSKTPWLLAATAALGAVGASVYLAKKGHPALLKATPPITSGEKPNLPGFIVAHAADKSPKVQDLVAASRLRLGFAEANASWKAPNDRGKKVAAYQAARRIFLAAARGPKGTGEMDPDYGTLTDQAAYQAAVCLVGEGKATAARGEFVAFMKARPESPLCKACRDRLVRLNGGKSTPEFDGLLQRDIAVQERRIRFEYSVCGPKAIEAVLPLIGAPANKPPGAGALADAAPKGQTGEYPDYNAIAKLCGTTDTGTTIEGMRKGLKALGVMSYAFQLNAADFDALRAPIILLRQTHYLVVTKLDGKTAAVYDPTTKRTETLSLPKSDDTDFVANVITFKVPTLAVNP